MSKAATHIQFVTMQEIRTIPKYWWLDSFRWRLVKLLGGENPHEALKIVRVPIDAKTFIEKLFKQKRQMIDEFRREPKRLLIGADDYEEMMDCSNIRERFAFHANYNKGPYVYGLTVEVIPWMRGILVMP